MKNKIKQCAYKGYTYFVGVGIGSATDVGYMVSGGTSLVGAFGPPGDFRPHVYRKAHQAARKAIDNYINWENAATEARNKVCDAWYAGWGVD